MLTTVDMEEKKLLHALLHPKRDEFHQVREIEPQPHFPQHLTNIRTRIFHESIVLTPGNQCL
jgi:hypothetical protein